jgi:iron complex transport system substrate-binding protein
MPPLRIVSLLPSATEILFALGLGDQVVGVSHECDFPPAARSKKVVIHSRIPKETPSGEIDRMVREFSARGESVYAVDAAALRDLAPDLIITQDLCHVCAASPVDLSAVLATLEARPEVLSLNPLDLGDVWRDILWVGDETIRGHEAERLLESIGQKLGVLERQVEVAEERPRVVFLEWLAPLYVGGHWVPEMIEVAGGRDALGRSRTSSYRVTAEEVSAAKPDFLLIAPCGYTAEQARREYFSLPWPPQWQDTPAVRNGRVYCLEANSYFSRPGPRLITGLELLAKLLHPNLQVSPEAEAALVPVVGHAPAARAASVR